MGKDFIPTKANGGNLRMAYNKVTRRGTRKVVSASQEKYFKVFPDFSEVEEVNVGSSGTKLDVIELKNGDFIEVGR